MVYNNEDSYLKLLKEKTHSDVYIKTAICLYFSMLYCIVIDI